MVEKIFNFFSSISPLFALFIISLVPLIEERGALIFAASIAIDWKLAMPICIISNFLPVPFLLLFGTKIIHWLKETKTFGSFFTKYDEKLHVKSEKYKKYGFLALKLFVGIPLPGTGAWTGTLAASFLNLDFKTSISAVALGVVLAGIIMSLGSKIVAVLGWAGIIAIIIAILFIIAISIFLKKRTKN